MPVVVTEQELEKPWKETGGHPWKTVRHIVWSLGRSRVSDHLEWLEAWRRNAGCCYPTPSVGRDLELDTVVGR